ncbi:methyl-accepting chemotaxis protein [Paenibacillus sp. YPG26]|uniref:methyl-accepting chemotaxis protein n=1 Tax=Paenibacillus sp. YPG26 TaxID=2878915 RepID=UPI00203E9E51|nr:methyl-accepting chemotaxis protein [Paenibacillus sp. YPG26]USB34319.1 methyl-accepting chemotaxis protein [Paenibacillus sp. YPG26]
MRLGPNKNKTEKNQARKAFVKIDKNQMIRLGKKAVAAVRNIKLGPLDPSKSVGVRLFLIFFVAIMFFVLTLGIISYQMAKSTIENTAKNANQQTIIQTSEKLDIILKQYENDIQRVYMETEVQTNLVNIGKKATSEYDRFTLYNTISKRFKDWIFTTEGVQGMYLIPIDGSFRGISAGPVDQELLEDFKKKYPGKEFSDRGITKWVRVDKNVATNTEPVFRLIKTMTTIGGGSKSYYLVADIRTQVLNDQLKKISLGDDSKVQLLSPDGNIVASSIQEENNKKTEYTVINGEKNNSGSLFTENSKDQSVLAAYNTQVTSGWKVVGILPTANLVKDAKGILLTTFISAVVVALIAILIGIWMVRMIARPLGNMKNLMREGATGNLSVRVTHKSRDEIGQLAASFNLMMEHITELVKQTNASAQEVLDTANDLSKASDKTAMSAREIAIATEEIANGAGSLATEAERGNALSEDISNQMYIVIEANQSMQESARAVEKSSHMGTEFLNNLMSKTNSTAEITQSLSQKVDSLKNSTSSVLKVLEVMQNITKQTNILSLNATIEAARAGAAGRGFMVVADEIRQLAEQSRQSITMVAEITDQIQDEMNQTVTALAAANPLFADQISSVKETNEIFVSVQQQMESFLDKLGSVTESIDGLNQSQTVLSDAMANVSAVAEESSATSEEVASLSNEQQSVGQQLVQLSDKLSNVSNGLKESLSKFRVE